MKGCPIVQTWGNQCQLQHKEFISVAWRQMLLSQMPNVIPVVLWYDHFLTSFPLLVTHLLSWLTRCKIKNLNCLSIGLPLLILCLQLSSE